MTAYAVGLDTMHRRDWVDNHRNPVTAPIARHGGRNLVRASTCRWEMLEGNLPSITGITLVQFPTIEEARSWHRDAESQPFIELRQAGSQLDLMLVEDPAIE